MRWLKHTLSVVLLLVALGIFLATLFSDHSDDYGQVSLPQGGTVHLPEGKVTVYDRLQGDASEVDRGTAGMVFQVEPTAGGSAVGLTLDNGETSELQVQRSETIGEFGSIGKLDVPASGDYLVSGSTDLAPGSLYLDFGTNAGNALLNRWKLLAGLLFGALLLALIPAPRSGRRREDAPGEPQWSSDPRAPYAG
jgi:hypothetical protein